MLLPLTGASVPASVRAHGGGTKADGSYKNRKTRDDYCHSAKGAAPRRETQRQDLVGGAHFRNCSEVRAARAAPVRRGARGYGPHFDRDNDGIGCE